MREPIHDYKCILNEAFDTAMKVLEVTKTGQQESKNHHYVPQCLLRNFCKPGKKKKQQVFVFDKFTGSQYSTSTRNVGSENNFNAFQLGEQKINFEEIFQVNDDLTARIVKKITDAEDLQVLDQEERFNLIEITLVQLLRTKSRRTAFIELSEQLRLLIQQANLKLDPTSEQQLGISDNVAKLISLRQLGDIDQLIPLLDLKTLVLLKTTSRSHFGFLTILLSSTINYPTEI